MKAYMLNEVKCQSPIYRDTHFYGGKDFMIAIVGGLVSIPYLSGHPFLLLTLIFGTITGIWKCQSPIYRDTHFYMYASMFEKARLICVNPLSIGTPISTRLCIGHAIMKKKCQSPIYRDTHFYNRKAYIRNTLR